MHAILCGNEATDFAMVARPSSRDGDRVGTIRARPLRAFSFNKNDYIVHVADSDESRAAAHQLVHDMYSWRGYKVSNVGPDRHHQITIAVLAGCAVVGTATLEVDSPMGVGADAIFKDHVDVCRDQGAKVCEITRFALARGACSEIVLAALFHFLFILAFHHQRCTHIFIEVNPRHRRFYEAVFGFKCQTDIRLNPRVNAPAYLLQVRTDYLASRIFHSCDEDVGFPRFYSACEVLAIRATLTHFHPTMGLPQRPIGQGMAASHDQNDGPAGFRT